MFKPMTPRKKEGALSLISTVSAKNRNLGISGGNSAFVI
jgi:hypothetical protein